MNSNGTKLKQVVHTHSTHRTSCWDGWPTGLTGVKSGLRLPFRPTHLWVEVGYKEICLPRLLRRYETYFLHFDFILEKKRSGEEGKIQTGLLTRNSKRQNDSLIFGCSFLRVAWIPHQLFFRERGRRKVGFALSDCKRGWSLEIEESCQEIVRNEVEEKVSKYFFRPAIVAGHFAILTSWRLPLLRRGIISLYLLSSAHKESLWLLLQISYLHSWLSGAWRVWNYCSF